MPVSGKAARGQAASSQTQPEAQVRLPGDSGKGHLRQSEESCGQNRKTGETQHSALICFICRGEIQLNSDYSALKTIPLHVVRTLRHKGTNRFPFITSARTVQAGIYLRVYEQVRFKCTSESAPVFPL